MTSIYRNLSFAAAAFVIAWTPSFAEAARTASSSNNSSLLTSEELDGQAVDTAVGRPSRGRRVNTAMLAALEAQEQLRRVELFLKSGPAQSGDLRVIETSKPGAH